MTGNDDLERKDDHLTKAAALCNVETGIEITTQEGNVTLDISRSGLPQAGLDAVDMTPYQALLLAEALVEVAKRAMGEPK